MRQTLGHYQLLEQIGSGGMGVVYRARDDRLERTVAIKVLSEGSLADEGGRRRFRREALALSKLNHPNIATIYDFNTFDGVDVLVMEDISGESLDEKLARGALPEADVVSLGRQLLTGLAAAHEQHVIHCDLKPGNMRVTDDGRLKILDFGLARALRTDGDATTASAASSLFAGTLPYMAPEQFASDRTPDARTDIYAAGAVLFEMATGRRPYGDLDGAPLVAAILNASVPSAREVNSRISERLDGIIRKALDKNPSLRYQTAREFLVDLERLAGGDAPVFTHGTLPRRTRAIITAAVAAIVLVTGWLGYREWPRHSAVQPQGWILLADFDNRTGVENLDTIVRDALTLQLQQSRQLNVLPREQVLDALRRMEKRSPELRLDGPTALELCRREGIPRYLTGTIRGQGGEFILDVIGHDAASSETMFTRTVAFGSEDDLLGKLDRVASDVRRELGESPAAAEATAAPKVTTGSYEALKLYTRGAELMARGDADGARPLLQSALDIDKDFAMAHALIARVYDAVGDLDREREHLGRAYALKDRLTERERLHVEAAYHLGRAENQQAIERLTAAVNLYPSDGEARYELAAAYRDNGLPSKAIDELEATIKNDPFVTAAYAELVMLLARGGNLKRAQEIYDESQRRNIHTARLDLAHGMLLLDSRRIDEARTIFQSLERDSEINAGPARLDLATADILEGKLRSAVDRLRTDILLNVRSHARGAEVKSRYVLFQVLLLSGAKSEAKAQADKLIDAMRDDIGFPEWQLIGNGMLAVGDMRRARWALAQLERLRGGTASRYAESCYLNLAGEIALAEQRPNDAVEAFTAARTQYPRAFAFSTRGLARAYGLQHKWPEARNAWTSVLAALPEFLHEANAADWLGSHVEFARIARENGDIAAARGAYAELLNVWRNGDPSPLRSSATTEFRQLPE